MDWIENEKNRTSSCIEISLIIIMAVQVKFLRFHHGEV